MLCKIGLVLVFSTALAMSAHAQSTAPAKRTILQQTGRSARGDEPATVRRIRRRQVVVHHLAVQQSE